jgi:hypothetical protein
MVSLRIGSWLQPWQQWWQQYDPLLAKVVGTAL